jgi:DNA replication protein DnaC
LAHDACRQGYDVLFVATHKMLQHINGGRADGTWERRLATYLRPDVLLLDDFGLKPPQGHGPADLYDVINERYEVGSIVLTSNRAPAEWPELFGDPLLASAGLDRLAHHAETLIITGTSFRARGSGSGSGSVPPASVPPAVSPGSSGGGGATDKGARRREE